MATQWGRLILWARAGVSLWVALVAVSQSSSAQVPGIPGEVILSAPTPSEPITIAADHVQHWTDSDRTMLLLDGQCYIAQGLTYLRSRRGVIWISAAKVSQQDVTRLVVYLEGDVRVRRSEDLIVDEQFVVELGTREPLRFEAKEVIQKAGGLESLYQRALSRVKARSAGKQREEQQDGSDQPMGETITLAQMAQAVEPAEPQPPLGQRRLRMFPRSRVPFQAEAFRQPGPPPEHVVVISGGVNLVIDGVEGFGTVDVATDRMVLWTQAAEAPDLLGETVQSSDTPLELYLEGNVVIRQGQGAARRIIQARQVYYNVHDQRAEVIDGELKVFDPRFGGPMRFRAERFSQLARDRFYALQAWFSTSKMGRPGYRVQASDVYLEDWQEPLTSPVTGLPQLDPQTGEPAVQPRRRVTAWNNVFYLDELPIFYWPVISTTLDDTDVALERIRLRQDRIFGTQVLTDWDMYELLGIEEPPPNTEWSLDLDFLSDRGGAVGSDFEYVGNRLFDIEGPYRGYIDTWWIEDHGKDTLGEDRRNLEPEDETRGRFLWRHRHQLPDDFILLAELSHITDRNFLEQFFEDEFDEEKDQETVLYLKQQRDNWAWSVLFRARINDFVTQSDWFPRLDHYLLGESLWDDHLTWFTHSFGGFSELRPASTPDDPADRAKFVRRPWEVNREGLAGGTRHEVDWPFNLGPVKFVPYVLGEVAGWTEDLSGDDRGRFFGVAGVRGSVPFWRVYPGVESQLWNVHDLAHKIVVDWDYSISESTAGFDRLPLYHDLDDDATEHFRRRFAINTFGGMIPLKFDERFYALRTGLANQVTNPAVEIADDFEALRAGIRQRLQTKRGAPEDRHIIDWMTLDVEATLFPDEDRDNFGEDVGLIQYDYIWHVGDRTSLLSSGQWDTFGDGGRLWSIGAYLARPPRGSFFLGFDLLDGPIDSQFVTFSYHYVLSPKWISSFVNQVDLGEDRNVGQSLVLTRVGADFLLSFGFNVDENKDNIGVSFALQPRVAPEIRVGGVRGAEVPAGAIAPFE